MKEIPLTQGKVALVDDEDYEWLNQWKWTYDHDGYARRWDYSQKPRKLIWMHRVIMNTPAGMEVDHRDQDGVNNQKINLRNCTRSQNQHNRPKQKNNTSGFIGVSKHYNKWRVQIRINRKRKTIGEFEDIMTAAIAYDLQASILHGDFAVLNFPDD